MGKPIVRFADKYFVATQWHNALISDQDEHFDTSYIRIVKQATQTAAAEHPNGIVNLAFVRAGMQPSDKATSQELTRLHKVDMASLPILASIVVIESQGIYGSAMRTLIRTMLAMSGYRKMEIKANANEGMRAALAHVRPSDGSIATRTDLEAAVKIVRGILDTQRAVAAQQAQR